MAQIGSLKKIINNTICSSSDINNNFNDIKTIYNSHDTATTGVHGLGTDTIADYTSLKSIIDTICPIGKVLDIWRPDSISFTDTIDEDIWALADGSTVSDGDSVFNGLVLPDLDNKYLIGAGSISTPGSIATDNTIDAVAIGNTNHIVDISHTHTLDNHTHDGTVSHKHRMSHNHSMAGYARIYVNEDFYGGYNNMYLNMDIHGSTINSNCTFEEDAYSFHTGHKGNADDIPSFIGPTLNMTSSGYTSYYTSSASLTISNPSSTDLSTELSNTQSFQPKSLKVKRYIRYK